MDCATAVPGRDPVSDIDAVEAELAAYTPTLQGDSALGDLMARPRAVVLNKIDVPEARELAVDAWRMVVPKKLSRAYDLAHPDGPG